MSKVVAMPEILDRFAAAQVAGDTQALRALTTDDFRLVGPLGFTLTREQWLPQFHGPLNITSLVYSDELERRYGDVRVIVAVHTQEATHAGNPAGGTFRATVIVAGDRIAGFHLSPIAT